MAISLYDVSVANFLQTVGAVSAYLDKGLKWADENGHDAASIVETRLHGDMLPFRFQIISVVHHSKRQMYCPCAKRIRTSPRKSVPAEKITSGATARFSATK